MLFFWWFLRRLTFALVLFFVGFYYTIFKGILLWVDFLIFICFSVFFVEWLFCSLIKILATKSNFMFIFINFNFIDFDLVNKFWMLS